jgi:type IV secretory pathway VirB6-like protein
LTFDEWLELLLTALLYPSMVLASMLFLYLVYRFFGWVD